MLAGLDGFAEPHLYSLYGDVADYDGDLLGQEHSCLPAHVPAG
jgi:hypothetical protein